MDMDSGVLPSAAGMRAYVAEVVDRLTERNRLPLDYSVASLRLVDLIVDGARRGRAEAGQVGGLLQNLGAYTGEVIVRRAGARWVDFRPEQRELFSQPVGIRMPDGRLWNPLGKVVKRFELGSPEESVQRFYLLLHGRTRKDAAPVDPTAVCVG